MIRHNGRAQGPPLQRYAGVQAFAEADPVVFVIGWQTETVDAKGAEVFMFGSCARANIVNAKKIIHIDKCHTQDVFRLNNKNNVKY